MYSFIRGFNKLMKTGMYDYVNLECNDPEDASGINLITKDGGFVSVFKIDGSFMLVGDESFRQNLNDVVTALTGALKKPGYKIDFVFRRDPQDSKRRVDESVDLSRQTAKHLQLNIGGLLDERSQMLSDITSDEACYMVVSTLPGVLNKSSYKAALAKRIEDAADFKVGIQPGEFAQSHFFVVSALRQIHRGFTSNIYRELKKICRIRALKAHSAIAAIRLEIDPDTTTRNWRPNLLGDKIPLRLVKESGRESDLSHLMNPSIAYQLFSRRPEILRSDSSLIRVGARIIAPLMIDIPPQEPRPFSELFEKIDMDIPWRWSFSIETGHNKVMSKVANKKSFAQFLASLSSGNRMIRDAALSLLEMARQGDTLVMGSMSICTWGPTEEAANRNKQMLAQAITSWGNTDVIEEFGDPISSWMDTVPGVSARSISTPFAIELHDAITMIPCSRPASPWDTGSMLYRTPDNLLYPQQPGSSKQTAWNEVYFAPPGFGKSASLAATNMGLILAAGNRVLPRIAILDIGPSSEAFIDLVRCALPESKRHLAQSYRLEMSSRYRVNPFDTPLGCQFPLAVDREFLVNLLTLLLTPAGAPAIERLPELTGRIIDAMYEYFSEESTPNIYEEGLDDRVDKALCGLGFNVDPETSVSWWQITKMLFDKALFKEAGLAQRYAVPNLNDATTVLSESKSLRDIFGDAQRNGENMLKFIEGMLTSAVSEYPILAGPSVFDVGSARICSMDLSAVAKGGSAQADKRVGAMYMLARQMMCRDFYRNEDTLLEIPGHFRPYHARIIEQDAGVPKKQCLDEFHRTSSSPAVRMQVLQDMREGRKFNVHVTLLSQSLDDFDETMLEFTNSAYILSKGNSEDTVAKIQETFKPTRDSMKALRRHVTGPGPGGAPFLFRANIKGDANVEMVLYLSLGPQELWAYNSTHEDARLRSRLASRVGLGAALRILAKAFPSGGGAKALLTSLSVSLDDESSSAFDSAVDHLVAKHKDDLSG